MDNIKPVKKRTQVVTQTVSTALAMPIAKPHEPKSSNRLKRHRTFIIIVVALFVLTGCALAAVAVFTRHPKVAVIIPKPTPTPTPTPSPTPVTKPAPLTGLPVDPALADRPISAVMIENLYPDARPQSGLGSAGVVYEALVEGGITRFMALFGDTQPTSIGPVRSLRPYYIDWDLEYGASLSHAGGSSDALSLVGPLHVFDLNALIIGAPTYYRTSDRYAPHNLYTSSALLDKINLRYGFTAVPSFTPSPRKIDTPPATPLHPIIGITFGTSAYNVSYHYDAKANNYVRYLGGIIHVDRGTGSAITVKNVVAEYMPITYTPAPHASQYINMPTVGSGRAIVFRDGDAFVGTWSKVSHTARTQLTDASGTAIPLDAGNTWYEIVPSGNSVTY